MKKSKFRLNWVDLLIVVLVIGLVAGTYMKFRVSDKTSVAEPQTPITYQVLLANVRQGTVDAIQVGDTLYDDDSGRDIGVIQSVDVSPATSLVQDTEGALHWADTDNRFDLILTVEGKGTVSGNSYVINRIYSLNVGSFRQFYTKYSTWQGRIWDIEM